MVTPDVLAAIESDYPLVDPATGQSTPHAQVLDAIETLLADSVDINYYGERVIQLLRLERADNFYRGIQNIAPAMDPASGSLYWMSYGANGAPTAGSNAQDYDRVFDYNPRLASAYGQKFVSVLGQRPFYNTTFEPLDPTSESDRRGARQVNLLIQMLHTEWKVRTLNHRLAYYLYKTGTSFGHVRPCTDPKKYGYYTVTSFRDPEQIEIQPGGFGCPQCGGFTPGPPPQDGVDPFCQNCASPIHPGFYQDPVTAQVPSPEPQVQQYPRTSIQLELGNGYIYTYPFNTVMLEDSPWFVGEVEKDLGKILQHHPNARKIVGSEMYGTAGALGDTASATAAVVRAAAQSQTGTVRSRNTNLRTYRCVWLGQEMLELIKDDAIRAQAIADYRDGVKIIRVEGKTIAIRNRDFRDEFSACMPQMADYLFADGSSWAIQGLEDGFSNLLNIAAETYEAGITKYLVHPDYADADALNRSRYGPERFISAIPGHGENLEMAFATFPKSDPPTGMPQLMEMYKELIEGVLGLLPAVYGDMPQNQTLGQARMMLNQGLLQLSTTAELMSEFWADTDTNGVKMYVKYVQADPQYKGDTIDLDLIRNSNWVIRGSSTMPRSYAERKDSLNEIITQNPDMAKAMGVTDPVNFPKLQDYLDLPDLVNVTADMVEAVREVVDQLWAGQPQPMPQPDGSTQLQPSIQFDPVVFDPKVAVSVAQHALLENRGQQRQTTPGYQNVRAFLQAAKNILDQQAQVQPQPPRLSISADVAKLPPEQEIEILKKYGINVQPSGTPSLNTQNKITQEEQTHRHQIDSAQLSHAQELNKMHTQAAMQPTPGLGPDGQPLPPPLAAPSPSPMVQ